MLRTKHLITSYFVANVLLGAVSFAEIVKISSKSNNNIIPQKKIIFTKTSSNSAMQAMQSVVKLQQKDVPYAKGEAIIIMKEGLSYANISSILSSNGASTVKEFKTLSAKNSASYLLISSVNSTENLIKSLKNNPNVKSISPNYKRKKSALPNDSRISESWGLYNTGQSVNGTLGTADADINAIGAWRVETNASETVVAIFDSGVDYTHEDLKDNMWRNSGETAGDGIDNDSNGFIDDIHGYNFAAQSDGSNSADVMDSDGHGTHIAGIIGAKGDNTKGISGVNWDVKMMAFNIYRPSGFTYDSDILEAIEYLLDMKSKGENIVAVNASYGGTGGSQTDPMKDAIKSLGDEGIVFVVAAGNDGYNNDITPSYPASYNTGNIIAVGASDQNDELVSWSHHGKNSVDIVAPGVNILSTLPGGGVVDTSIFSDDMESGMGSWIHTGSGDTWAITNENAQSGTLAWSDSPDANYTANDDASLSYSTDIDLLAYAGERIGLGACLMYELEDGYDFLYVEVSGNSGTSWTEVSRFTGSQNDWFCAGVVIPEDLKTANFRMRFRLDSDGSGHRDGVYIDDIRIGSLGDSAAYGFKQGTSMATPYVTGSIALVAKQFPSENVYQRINRIYSAADKLSALTDKVATGARLNIGNAMQADISLKPMIIDVNKTQGLKTGDILTIVGMEFGASEGKVYFDDANSSNQPVEALMLSWSDEEIIVEVPEGAGRYLSIETASGEKSVNSLIVTAWEPVAPIVTARQDAAVATYNDKLYVFSGSADSDNLSSSEVYDAQNDSWEDIANIPTPRTQAAAVALNDKIYVIGGFANYVSVDTVESYNPATDEWNSTVAPLPQTVHGGQAVILEDSLYFVAGVNNWASVNTLYRYNESNNTWSEMATLNIARSWHVAAVFNGKIYAFTGFTDTYEWTKTVEEYDPATNTWTTKSTEMPSARWVGAGAANKDGIIIAGGHTGPDEGYFPTNNVMFYDPSTDVWNHNKDSITDYLAPKTYTSMAFMENRGFYIICGQGSFSNEVEMLNIAAIAQDDVATTDEDSSIDVAVLDNDSDAEGNITIVSVTTPVNGTSTISASVVNYMPNVNFNGTDSFSYTITDGNGVKRSATVTLTVNPINDKPVAIADTVTTDEDQAVNIDVLANDSDIDGDTLTVLISNSPSNGSTTVNADGTVTYTPNADFNGSDNFEYKLVDMAGGSAVVGVEMTVNPINDTPVAIADTATTEESQAVNIAVLSNDSDIDADALTVSIVVSPSNGVVAVNADNTIKYTPSIGFSGTDTFTYMPNDGTVDGNPVVVSIEVNATVDTKVIVIAKILEYAENAGEAPTVQDYQDAGIEGVTAENLDVVNEAMSTLLQNQNGIQAEDRIQEVADNAIAGLGNSGGGCTYNPNNNSIDFTIILMILGSLLYPIRRRLFS
ncbi:MAG: tandem-95 repeat protein [Sulfurovum sp.]|nr:tandem-95 repeat protein [Sulfurovum sp.]